MNTNDIFDSACSYRLMEDLEHGGGGLCLVLLSYAFYHGLFVHSVVVVDHLPRHLEQEQRGFYGLSLKCQTKLVVQAQNSVSFKGYGK